MAYTLLRVTERGTVLYDYHVRRFEDEGEFATRVRELPAGVWAVQSDSKGVQVESRGESRMQDCLPTRFVVSPMAEYKAPFPKPASPSPYDGVRKRGVVSLLTSLDGEEIWEACSAAVIGWNGSQLVCVPSDRPRVQSTAETAIREHLSMVERPLLRHEDVPILLVNAVKGTCAVELSGRPPFPKEVRDEIEKLLGELTG